MDFSNERYVRVYTRDTTRMLMMEWDERWAFWELLRKVDRAGVLDLGGEGAEGLAVQLRCPLEVAQRAAAAWHRAGCADVSDDRIVIMNYLPAQEAVQSDAQRQRAARERRLASEMAKSVTPRDEPVTPRDETVTLGHDASRAVTPCLAVPCLAVPVDAGDHEPRQQGMLLPEPTPPASRATKKELGKTSDLSEAWSLWVEAYKRKYPDGYTRASADGKAMQSLVKLASAQANGKHTRTAILGHWFECYLETTNAWLLDAKHPLRCLDRDIPSFGLPGSRHPRSDGGYPYPKLAPR